MAALPVLIAPYDDELMYSYFLRLAKTMDVDWQTFWCTYIHPYHNGRHRNVARYRYDMNSDISLFLSQVTPLLKEGETISDFYLDHMYYTGYAPLLNQYQQTDWINKSTREGSEMTDIISRIHSDMLRDLKICPMCLGIDGMHYKRMHQMPGVNVCPIHGIPLLKYKGRKGFEICESLFEPVSADYSVNEIDKQYAVFAASLLTNDFETNSTEIGLAIKKFLKEIGYTHNAFDVIRIRAHEIGREDYVSEDLLSYIEDIFSRSGVYKRRLRTEKLLKTIFILFRNKEELKKYVTLQFPSEEEFVKYADEQGYDLVSNYHRYAITLRHRKCGNEFISTPESFMNGWECPHCDEMLSDQELFAKLFYRSYGEDYRLLSPFTSLDAPVTVKHLVCGSEYQIRAKALLKEQIPCKCVRNPNSQENAELIMKDFPEWKLIKFDGIRMPATLQHIPCGHVRLFSRFDSFTKYPNCDKCRLFAYDEERFEKKLKDLYGNRITMAEPFVSAQKDLKFHCNICGSDFIKLPQVVLRGSACPECASAIKFSYNEFQEYIKGLSEDRYEIIDQPKLGRYIIKDTITGKEQNLTRQMILQELMRPTPSEILPLDMKQNVKSVTEASIKVIRRYLSKVKSKIKYFYYKDLYEDLVTSEKLSRRAFLLGWFSLLPCKEFRKIQDTWGMYLFAGESIDYDELIEEKYLLDEKGNHIGYFTGFKFLCDLGLDVQKGKTISIMSNKQLGKGDGLLTIDGRKYGIAAPLHGPVSEENYSYKAVLAWIQGSLFSNDEKTIRAVGDYFKKHSLTREGFVKELKTYIPNTGARLENLYRDFEKYGIEV